MSPLLLIPIAWAVGIPIAMYARSIKLQMEQEDAQSEEGERYDVLESMFVLSVLSGAYKSLQSQKASKYGPWISSLLDSPGFVVTKDEKGVPHVSMAARYVSPVTALIALNRTLDELEGSRFNVDGLYEAIAALEDHMGAGE